MSVTAKRRYAKTILLYGGINTHDYGTGDVLCDMNMLSRVKFANNSNYFVHDISFVMQEVLKAYIEKLHEQ